MPRIQINTDDLRLKRLDEIAAELTKDRDISVSARRSAAFDYLVDAIVNATQTINSQRADLARLSEMAKSADEISPLREEVESLKQSKQDLEDDLGSTSAKLEMARDEARSLSHGVDCMEQSMLFILTRLREYKD